MNQQDDAAIDVYQLQCYTASTGILAGAQESFASNDWLQYTPDFTFSVITFAAVTLLRLCRSRVRPFYVNIPSVMDLIHASVDAIDNSGGAPSQASGRHAANLRKMLESQEQGSEDTEMGSWPDGFSLGLV